MDVLALLHGFAALLLDLVPVASAADASTTAATSTPSAGGLVLLIAYLTRRREIGGWLMLYYWGLYSGAAVTLFLVASTIGNLAPGQWAAIPTWRYLCAVISSLLPVAFIFAEVIAGSMLLAKRNFATLKLLRLVLIGYLLADAIAVGLNLAIYIKPWDESALNIYSAIVGSIWLAYFYVSTRVKAVFITRTWVYAGDTGKPAKYAEKVRAPAEKKYRTRRSLVLGVGFFIAVYGWYTINPGNAKNPDEVGRFIATAVIAVVFGLIGYFLPIIGKAKRDSLRGIVPLTADDLRLEEAPPRPPPPSLD
jgi:hypothetical protein